MKKNTHKSTKTENRITNMLTQPAPRLETQVYRALLQLGCEWRMLSSYRIQCMWRPDNDTNGLRGPRQRGGLRTPPGGGVGYGGGIARRDVGGGGAAAAAGGAALGGISVKGQREGYRVIAGLTLYKVRVGSKSCGGCALGRG